LIAFFGLAAVAIFIVAHALPGQHQAPPAVLTMSSVVGVSRAFATLALMIAPVTAIAIVEWWRHWRPVDAIVGAVAGLLASGPSAGSLLATGRWPRMLVGNLLEQAGVLCPHLLVGTLLEQAGVLVRGALAGDRLDLYAATWWQLLNIAAIVAAI